MDVIAALVFAYLVGPVGLILLALGLLLIVLAKGPWRARAPGLIVTGLLLTGCSAFAWRALLTTNFGL